jgi:hypothetical protein
MTCLALTACGGSSSSGSPSPGDAPASDDAAPGNGTLTLSGTAREISTAGQTPLAGVVLTAYKASDDSVLGTATSAADGTFSITVTATSVDGYLKATTPGGYKDSYLYPPVTLTSNYTDVPVFVLKTATYNLVNSLLLMNNQSASNGWIAILIQDATGAPVLGATATSTPLGQIDYNDNNLPSTSASATAADGIAYDTNVTAGTVTVSASKAGSTFVSHAIKVRPNVVTLTIVPEALTAWSGSSPQQVAPATAGGSSRH